MTLDASFGNDNKDLRCVNIMIQYKCVVAVQQLASSTVTHGTRFRIHGSTALISESWNRVNAHKKKSEQVSYGVFAH